jgi:predicted DNA binding CopG/RHH family protein
MSKSVPIKLKPKDAAQAFVEAAEEPRARDLRSVPKATAGKADMVRITLDLPKSQHRRLKIHVAGEGITIADYLRDLLDERLP